MESIKLDSRYKDVETIYHHINDNCGVIITNGAYIRCIYSKDNSNLEGIDFEGGPMLTVGDSIPGVNKKIKSIKKVLGFYVELE